MSRPILHIGNRNFSSWSLRPWLAFRHLGLDFDTRVLPLDTPQFRQDIAALDVAGRVPVLVNGDLRIWDSLAICEYGSELAGGRGWPPAAEVRAPRPRGELRNAFQFPGAAVADADEHPRPAPGADDGGSRGRHRAHRDLVDARAAEARGVRPVALRRVVHRRRDVRAGGACGSRRMASSSAPRPPRTATPCSPIRCSASGSPRRARRPGTFRTIELGADRCLKLASRWRSSPLLVDRSVAGGRARTDALHRGRPGAHGAHQRSAGLARRLARGVCAALDRHRGEQGSHRSLRRRARRHRAARAAPPDLESGRRQLAALAPRRANAAVSLGSLGQLADLAPVARWRRSAAGDGLPARRHDVPAVARRPHARADARSVPGLRGPRLHAQALRGTREAQVDRQAVRAALHAPLGPLGGRQLLARLRRDARRERPRGHAARRDARRARARAVAALRRRRGIHAQRRRPRGRVVDAARGREGAVVDELRSLFRSRRGQRRAAQSHRGQPRVGHATALRARRHAGVARDVAARLRVRPLPDHGALTGGRGARARARRGISPRGRSRCRATAAKSSRAQAITAGTRSSRSTFAAARPAP